MKASDRLIVALDVPGLAEAGRLLDRLAGEVRFFKVGMELYNSTGPSVIELVRARGARVFLDLKLHDIPNTVARTAEVLGRLGVAMFNVHASGGPEMMRGAAAACSRVAAEIGGEPPLILGVTVLTSLDRGSLAEVTGADRPVGQAVVQLARLARDAGLAGVVCSPGEVAAVKQACGRGFLAVTPGIRPAWAARSGDDQRRVLTPAAAIAAGADYLVVGRPITAAPDPARAGRLVLQEMEEASRA